MVSIEALTAPAATPRWSSRHRLLYCALQTRHYGRE